MEIAMIKHTKPYINLKTKVLLESWSSLHAGFDPYVMPLNAKNHMYIHIPPEVITELSGLICATVKTVHKIYNAAETQIRILFAEHSSKASSVPSQPPPNHSKLL